MSTGNTTLQSMVETLIDDHGFDTYKLAAAVSATGTKTSQATMHRIRRGEVRDVGFALGCAICQVWFVHAVQVRDDSVPQH